MSEQHDSYSSGKHKDTPVKVNIRRKTVGITLPQELFERARAGSLNISGITEQALDS